jgi:HAD superfamily hydrolase (TIGR01490 family)
MKQSPVAFFDIDGTVFRSSLLIELVNAFIAEGIFPVTARDQYLESYLAWQRREGTYEAYISDVVTTFLAHLKGVPYTSFVAVGQSVVAIHSKRVYRYTRDLLASVKRAGYVTIAISQSPKTILDVFCQEYGFDKVYGRLYELGPQDCLTGNVIDEHLIENKANIVARVFERHPELSPAGSLAVGDTDGDIPLLGMVERPICFNPNRALYMHAKKHAWPIVVERKDVIYHLDGSVTDLPLPIVR